MRGPRSPLVVVLSEGERRELQSRARGQTIEARHARRARVVLLAAEGKSVSEIARLVDVTRKVVREWLNRFIKKRVQGMGDRPGRGRKPTFSPSGSNALGEDSL